MDQSEKEEVVENLGLSSPLVYEIVRKEGVEELQRPANSLFWSGIAAGLVLSLSVYCKAFLYHALEGHPLQSTISCLGYSVGFVIVILGHLQLFTENTITVVLPVLGDCNRHKISKTMQLWGIVFGANMIGALISALAVSEGGILPPEQVEASISISKHLMHYSASQTLLYGIPAGFIIASIVWILPSIRSNSFWMIVFLTTMISLGGLTHVVAGATEWFLLSINGHMSWTASIFSGILPALIGNIIGGTGLFALIAYAQVKDEI